MRELGRAVRDLRETAGLERKELAAEAEISEAFLIKIEQNKRGMSPATLARIAGALGVEVEELVTRAALLEASTATSPQERYQATFKAAAASPAMVAGIGLLALAPIGAVAAAAAAIMVRRARTRETPELPHSASEARQFLIDQIQAMPDEQVLEVARLANDIKNTAPYVPAEGK